MQSLIIFSNLCKEQPWTLVSPVPCVTTCLAVSSMRLNTFERIFSSPASSPQVCERRQTFGRRTCWTFKGPVLGGPGQNLSSGGGAADARCPRKDGSPCVCVVTSHLHQVAVSCLERSSDLWTLLLPPARQSQQGDIISVATSQPFDLGCDWAPWAAVPTAVLPCYDSWPLTRLPLGMNWCWRVMLCSLAAGNLSWGAALIRRHGKCYWRRVIDIWSAGDCSWDVLAGKLNGRKRKVNILLFLKMCRRVSINEHVGLWNKSHKQNATWFMLRAHCGYYTLTSPECCDVMTRYKLHATCYIISS